MPFAAKVIGPAVALKAILMGVLVTLLAAAGFVQSLILVLVSATATGIFGIVIVVIQTHSERNLHRRLDTLEEKANTIEGKADSIEGKTNSIVTKTNAISDKQDDNQ
jgi:Flp pilus assembly protein TadB